MYILHQKLLYIGKKIKLSSTCDDQNSNMTSSMLSALLVGSFYLFLVLSSRIWNQYVMYWAWAFMCFEYFFFLPIFFRTTSFKCENYAHLLYVIYQKLIYTHVTSPIVYLMVVHKISFVYILVDLSYLNDIDTSFEWCFSHLKIFHFSSSLNFAFCAWLEI